MSYLNIRRADEIEYLELNRPEVRNALDDRLIAELTEWSTAIASDNSVRAVVISGAGPSFSAGADVAWMRRMVDRTRDENLADAAAVARMFEAIDTLPVPVIARVHGAAMGGGVGLVAVADIAVAAEEAMFGLTEVQLGLIPAVIGPYVLAKIGQSAARELFLTGWRFDAAYAKEIGLVHAVTSPDDMDKVIGGYLKLIRSAGREAIAAAKMLIRQIAGRAPRDVMSITADAIATRRVSVEAQELMRRFLDKK